MYDGLTELTETANRLYADRQWPELSDCLREIRKRAPHYWRRWLADEFDAPAELGNTWAGMWVNGGFDGKLDFFGRGGE